jgi:hypothetical protein
MATAIELAPKTSKNSPQEQLKPGKRRKQRDIIPGEGEYGPFSGFFRKLLRNL